VAFVPKVFPNPIKPTPVNWATCRASRSVLERRLELTVAASPPPKPEKRKTSLSGPSVEELLSDQRKTVSVRSSSEGLVESLRNPKYDRCLFPVKVSPVFIHGR